MKALAPTAWVGVAAIFAASCGITVTVPGQASDSTSSGAGGAGGTGTGAGPGETGAGAGAGQAGTGGVDSTGSGNVPPANCPVACTVPPSGETCNCTEQCGDTVGGPETRISCAPITDLQGNHKVECVCSLSDFSGVCFELNLANLCNFKEGCCANYFSGK